LTLVKIIVYRKFNFWYRLKGQTVNPCVLKVWSLNLGLAKFDTGCKRFNIFESSFNALLELYRRDGHRKFVTQYFDITRRV